MAPGASPCLPIRKSRLPTGADIVRLFVTIAKDAVRTPVRDHRYDHEWLFVGDRRQAIVEQLTFAAQAVFCTDISRPRLNCWAGQIRPSGALLHLQSCNRCHGDGNSEARDAPEEV
jgi:hypothetical protein